MAVIWTAKIDAVVQVGTRAVIDVTITKTPDLPKLPKVWPFHIEYTDAASITYAQVKQDTKAFAKTLSQKGAGVETLETKIGEVFNIDVN
jgi:hypothetical protein